MANMETNNNQPLIIVAVIVGAVLIIALALIFTRSDNSDTETANENNIAESAENDDNEEGNGEGSPEPETPEQPQNPENPEEPEQPEEPRSDVLPNNWASLTSQEKTDLNPFDCDTETQVIWETDGTCHDKAVSPSPSYRIDTPFTYQFEDGLEVKITSNFNCQPFIDVYNNLLSNDRSAEYADNLIDQFYEVLELPKTEDTFLRDAALYQQCSFEMVFENTGADYHYNKGASLRRYPYNSCNFAGPVAEPWPVLIDQSSNEHPSLRPYSLTPWPVSVVMTDPPTLARLVYTCIFTDGDSDLVFETGDVVSSDDDFVWLLSDDTKIQQMQVTLGNRGVESVVLNLAF